MKKCKDCQTEIDAKAKKCPHCQSDQRNWFIRHPIITVLLILFVFGLIGAASGNSSSTASNSTQPSNSVENTTTGTESIDNKPKEWVKVAELSGNSNKRSDTFELTGGKAKLTYTFDGGEYVIGSIYVVDEGKSLNEDGGFPEVTVTTAGTDSTFLTKKAGTYYLDITSANANWTVTIEEER